MLNATYPYFLANKPEAPNQELAVYDKYSGEVATRVAIADAAAIDRAIAAADAAAEPMRKLPAHKRQSILNHCVKRFEERFEELAEALCIEAGKPIKDARGEVTRLIETNIELIAVDQSAGSDLTGATIARTVTVTARPEQVAALAQAQATGRLSLALVGSEDDTIASLVEVDQRSLLGIAEAEAPVQAEEEKVCTIRNRRGGEVVSIPIPCSN